MNEPMPSAPPAAPAAPPVDQPEPEAVPPSWPGAFGVYKYSKAAIKFNFGAVIAFWLLCVALLVLYYVLVSALHMNEGLQNVISSIGTAIITPPALLLLFSGMDRQKTSLGEAFSNGMQYAVKYFVQNIVVTLILVVSLLALVVPFFFVMPRLVLAPYYLVRKNLGIIDSIKASWEETKGHVGKVYGVLGASIVMFLPVFTLIGIPVAIYLVFMYSAAFTILYGYVAEGTGKADADVETA